MTDAVTPLPAPPPCPADDEAEWTRALARRQLELLGELAEIGLEIARAVERQAQEPAAAPGDAPLAYSRVSRAVRLTLMLQSKLIEALTASDKDAGAARAAAEAEAAKTREMQDPAYQMKARIEAIVARVAGRRLRRDGQAVERVLRESAERLDDEDLYGDLLERPVSELVARLCKDLGLDPDWAELAEELWAVREVESGHIGWPLAARSGTSSAEGPACLSGPAYAPAHVPAWPPYAASP
jgi:hypothetical protein